MKLLSRKEIDFAPGENTFGLRVFKEVYGLPDGKTRTYWKYQKPDVVMIAAFTTDGKIIAEEEFQPGVGVSYLKLAGGNVDEGEEDDNAAIRELREETGYQAGSIELISTIAHDSGRSDAKVLCYLATDCKKVGEPEKGITITLLDPKEFWNRFMIYLLNDRGKTHGGSNSLKCIAPAMHKLGHL